MSLLLWSSWSLLLSLSSLSSSLSLSSSASSPSPSLLLLSPSPFCHPPPMLPLPSPSSSSLPSLTPSPSLPPATLVAVATSLAALPITLFHAIHVAVRCHCRRCRHRPCCPHPLLHPRCRRSPATLDRRGLPEHHCFCCHRGARPSPERAFPAVAVAVAAPPPPPHCCLPRMHPSTGLGPKEGASPNG